MLRTFSDNSTCRHIVFGGCHDAGYLLNLEHFKHNTQKASHITLLETTPAYRGFTDLANFKRARFDDVFKSEPLPDYIPPPAFTPIAIQPPIQPTVQPLLRSMTNKSNTSPTMTLRTSVVSPSPSVTPVSAVAPSESNGDAPWGKYDCTSVPEVLRDHCALTMAVCKSCSSLHNLSFAASFKAMLTDTL
jgi:hypothetical protein